MPPKEKSYFSQLTNGAASFGEKAARRIEKQYGMADGYLDSPVASTSHRTDDAAKSGPAHDIEQEHRETASELVLRLLPQMTETQKAEIADIMQSMADKNARLLAELLAREGHTDQDPRPKG
ncbi:hypothetical protein [Caballeronia sp. LZ035]|uniref:hypothetical protein n=1 Tax=Caballeronia sp. LZ035 TaxID=3038568 RepID=UPI00285D66D5|nr:hypothetical protein [Caballeronia sp. LZ035]MDR5756476.1 hypothetical protein [Caballeronia sp. LZ035]